MEKPVAYILPVPPKSAFCTHALPTGSNSQKSLKAGGHLVACGGGGFENHAGGLTLVRAKDIDEAMKMSAGSPMNEIGTTEILFWDVFYGDLNEKKNESL